MRKSTSVRAKDQNAKSDGTITTIETNAPWSSNMREASGLMTAQEVLAHAGIDFETVKEPIQTVSGYPISDKFAIRRTDLNVVLGVVGRSYEAYSNRRAMDDVNSIVQDSTGNHFDGAGSFSQGQNCYIQLKLGGDIVLKNPDGSPSDDVLKKYLTVSNSFDGSSPVLFMIGTIRIACWNSLLAAVKTAEEMFRARHTKKSLQDITADVRQVLGIVNKSYYELEQKMNKLIQVPLSEKGFSEYIEKLGFKTNSKRKGQADVVTALFLGDGAGSKLSTAKNTLYGGLQAITDFSDHIRQSRLDANSDFVDDSEARLFSNFYGSGLRLKERALDIALKIAA